MEGKTATAPGKIILSGEYAVVFGYPGVAVPAPLSITTSIVPDASVGDVLVEWNAHKLWQEYARDIVNRCLALGSVPPGTLTIACDIPLGKGMGSSTALVIAIAKCLLGENCKEEALAIEDVVNPGHSGLDFAVIWDNKPILFKKGDAPQVIELPQADLHGALLIDTGEPGEQTTELVAWIRSREGELSDVLRQIGDCSQKLLDGEPLANNLKAHHKAQQKLGIVTDKAKELIKKIEQEGGSAKIIGAGARTGGCGMILAINTPEALVANYPVIQL